MNTSVLCRSVKMHSLGGCGRLKKMHTQFSGDIIGKLRDHGKRKDLFGRCTLIVEIACSCSGRARFRGNKDFQSRRDVSTIVMFLA